MRMRTRTTILVAAVTAALLVGGVSPAAALSEQAAAAKAVAGRMLASPRAEAFVTRLPVRVVVRVPARTSRLWVRVGGRDVTARFRRAGGSLRVADLTRGDGVRYGHNHLVVLAERRGGRPVIDARSFVLARRYPELVRLRVRTGPVTSLGVRVAGGAGLAPEHFGQPGEVERRLSVIRRERTVRVWLNGRRVTRAVDRSRPTRWTASLSASHGLRYGVNRLRVLVAEPDRGRYAVLRRRFVLRRNRHLAAAGWDIATHVGERVRLDGRRSRTIRGGRPDHRWRIVSKPRGSRAKLRRARSARPLLAPDRRGRYVIGLTVTSHDSRATASQAPPSSADRVIVTGSPKSLLVPFKALARQGGRSGIQVGDTFYPNQSPNGAQMQWLTLNRATLTPTRDGNSWLDGTGSGGHGLSALTSALANEGHDQLVILNFPYFPPPNNVEPAMNGDQVFPFIRALKTLGVAVDPPFRIPDAISEEDTLAIVGVPSGGAGSGWFGQGNTNDEALRGWLMPDATAEQSPGAPNFRLQPERPAFDTSSSKTPTTNTMSIRDDRATASLPAGQTGGFQVVELDRVEFKIRRSDVFGSNGGLEAMTARLNQIRDEGSGFVAVQSIGHSAGSAAVASALAEFGANPHTFNTFDGSYAFIGGRLLERGEVADSSSAVVIDPTADPPTRESGTLSGRMSMRADGFWVPTVADPSDRFKLPLYDIVFSSPEPWPYTTGGAFPQKERCPAPGDDVAAYDAALSYIATGIGLPSYQSDLRTAYYKRSPKSTWSDQKTDLARLQFESGHGFSQAEFCNLKAELQDEFTWLDNVKGLFDTYEAAFNRSGAIQQFDLQKLGEGIRASVAPDDDAEIGWSVGGFAGNLVSAGLVFAAVTPEGTAALAAWEALVAVYELVRELVGQSGAPVGDQVTSKVGDLSQDVANRLFDTANGLDRLRQVIISDYGRLSALGPAANDPKWNIDLPTVATNLRTAAQAFFSWELMPVAYEVYALVGSDDPETCRDALYGHTWRGAPASAQMEWMGGYDLFGEKHQQARFLIGKHHLSIRYYAYPPKEVADPIFTPVKQGGYGVQLPRFIWEQYVAPRDSAGGEAPPGKRFPPTGITYCH
jgi:hypothetical protein